MNRKFLKRNYENGGRLVIILHEKHGNRYFPAETYQECCKSALRIFEERMRDPFFNWSYVPEEPEEAPYTVEECEAQSDNNIADVMYKKREQWGRKVREYKESKRFWEECQKAEDTQDAELAIDLLIERSDWEYERIEFENLS